MIFLDTETCGLHGPTVLLQWARNDGPISLHSIFKSRVGETLDLIEEFCFEDDGVTGFNLVYDWFHLCQTYTTLSLLKSDYDSDCIPEDRIVDYAYAEKDARDGLCLKPITCFDIMLHARKGPYQTLMDREDITVKKVPTAIAWELAKELTKRIPLPDVYFARRLDSSIRWQVRDIYDDFGDIIADFKDVVLAFAPSSALKALAGDALKIKQEDIMFYTDVELPAKAYPIEDGFAPFALAPYFEKKHDRRFLRQPNETNWFGKWPSVISMHINHWSYNEMARKYGTDDVDYTRRLYEHFGSPTPGDDDSVLACMVGAIRWRGFQLDIPAVSALKDAREAELNKITEKINFNSVDVCRKYLEQVLGETEKLVLKANDKISTKGIILEEIAKWKQEIVHDECQGQGCDKCAGGLLQSEVVHPAAIRAQEILDARHAKKEIELYEKLLIAGRFHASFTIIGTLSSRMAGSDGLNPQGIKRSKEVRACFTLAWPGMTLNGGDFDSFEVGLADAQYGDPVLHKDLTTLHDCFKCSTKGTINPDCDDCHGTGKEKTKIHGLFGTFLFPPMTYEQILHTKGLPGEKDKYTRSKNGVFCVLYGGEAYSLHTRVGVDEKVAEDAYQKWCSEYKVWGQERRKYFDLFCVEGSTWTLTSKGPRQVFEIIGEQTNILINGKVCKSEGFYHSGKKEVFKITTENGYSVIATAEHRFLVNSLSDPRRNCCGLDIWIPLRNLKIGDLLKLANQTNATWQSYGNYEEGYILGWLLGDGSIAASGYDNKLYFYNDDFQMMPYLETLTGSQAVYVPQSDCYYIRCSVLNNLIQEYAVGYTKLVTPEIEKASPEFYKGFITAFFDTDGSASKVARQISLSQSNIYRLQAVQRMLLRLGIQSSIKQANKSGKSKILGRDCNTNNSWTLNVYSENAARFFNTIGFRNSEKQAWLKHTCDCCQEDKKRKNYFVSKVSSIERVGYAEVYDIQVEKEECFEANGLIAHNCSMRQPGGIGTKVEWHDAADYIESMFGFRRYFTLENRICRALFDLAENPPSAWKLFKSKVTRRDRIQTVSGAVQSALFASAFAVQSANMRAGANHVIQSSGATLTKNLERRLWEIQPAGINHWRIMPLNIHDEVMAPTLPEYSDASTKIVKDFLDERRPRVPLIDMEWKTGLKNWSKK